MVTDWNSQGAALVYEPSNYSCFYIDFYVLKINIRKCKATKK